jgi:surfeit locus 1 family protein
VKLRALFVGVCVVLASATCVRLGFWQLSRMREKHALHAAQKALLAEPPIEVESSLPPPPPQGRRVRLVGRWDPSAIVLLSGRSRLGAAGVSLVSVLRLASGEGVLVERGWLAAADSRSAEPGPSSDSTTDVAGVALGFPRSPRPTAWALLPSRAERTRVWSARSLDPDSAAARFAPPLARCLLRALPERAPAARPGAEAHPIPEPYQVPDEAMHLSYAIQWFAFAAIIAGGSLALARRRRPAA